MATGIAVWLWSLVKALRLGRPKGNPDRLRFDEATQFATESGELEIRGEPAGLSKALEQAFRNPNAGLPGVLFKVTERASDRLVISKMGPLLANQTAGLYFSEVEFGFTPAGSAKVCVSYRIGYTRIIQRLKKIALGIVLGVGLPTILIVGFVIWRFVLQSPDPATRWQVFQALQIVHALWPPFLIMLFYTLGRRQSKVFVENLIRSVEELD